MSASHSLLAAPLVTQLQAGHFVVRSPSVPDKEAAGPSAKAVLHFSVYVNTLNPWRQKWEKTPKIDAERNAKYDLYSLIIL